MKKLSVVIPVYNWAELCGDAGVTLVINSLLHPSNAQYVDEVILVDDHSLRESKERYLPMCSSIPSLVYHELKMGDSRGGNRSLARNVGVGLARNEDLFLMDQDTVLTENYFAAMAEYLDHLGDSCMLRGWRLGSWVFSEEFIGVIPKSSFHPKNFQVHYCDYTKSSWCRDTFFHLNKNHHSKVWDMITNGDDSLHASPNLHMNPVEFISYGFYVKKSIFEKIGGFSLRFGGWGEEDIEFGWRAYKNGVEPLCCDRNLIVKHCPHPVHEKKIDEWVVNNMTLMSLHPDIMQYRRDEILHGLTEPCRLGKDEVERRIRESYASFIGQLGIRIDSN